MTVPSLILRLEPLAEPKVAGVPHLEAPPVELASRNGASVQTPLSRWSAAVAAAHDSCLVLDPKGAVVSVSAAGAELLGCSDEGVIGRLLLEVINVVDLDTGAARPEYEPRITPLAVLAGTGLMRSLMRIRRHDDSLVTVDTCSAPIHDATGSVVGSVSFLAALRSH